MNSLLWIITRYAQSKCTISLPCLFIYFVIANCLKCLCYFVILNGSITNSLISKFFFIYTYYYSASVVLYYVDLSIKGTNSNQNHWKFMYIFNWLDSGLVDDHIFFHDKTSLKHVLCSFFNDLCNKICLIYLMWFWQFWYS